MRNKELHQSFKNGKQETEIPEIHQTEDFISFP